MKYHDRLKLFCLILLISQCGSVFIEAPPEVDLSECVRFTKSFSTTTGGSAIPLPFGGPTGTRKVSLYTDKPELWDEYDGTLHLTGVAWDVTWMSEVSILLDGITIATYRGDTWVTGSTSVDLFPHIHETGNDRLVVEPLFRARGIKPSKASVIRIEVELAACGPSANDIFVDLVNLEQIEEEE